MGKDISPWTRRVKNSADTALSFNYLYFKDFIKFPRADLAFGDNVPQLRIHLHHAPVPMDFQTDQPKDRKKTDHRY